MCEKIKTTHRFNNVHFDMMPETYYVREISTVNFPNFIEALYKICILGYDSKVQNPQYRLCQLV